jgi:hypothetical protein
VRSGGGAHGYWRLAEPVPLEDADEAEIDEAEGYNRWIAEQLDADDCHNIDRIMRLPGTVNWPNEVKRARGRVPSIATLVLFDESRTYDLSQFGRIEPQAARSDVPAEFRGVSKALSDLTPNLQHVARTGSQPGGKKYRDKSRGVWAVACGMVREGADDESVAAVLTDPTLVISEHVLRQPKPQEYALKQARKARKEEGSGEARQLARMNSRYCITKDGGKVWVLEFKPQVQVNSDGHVVHVREAASYLTFGDFQNFHRDELVWTDSGQGDGTLKAMKLGTWWLDHHGHRKFEGLVFLPGKEREIDGTSTCGAAGA